MVADRGDEDFVFTVPGGGPVRHHNFYSRAFKPGVKSAGLDDSIRFHDLRHTCAAWLIDSGAHVRAIMEWWDTRHRRDAEHLRPSVPVADGEARRRPPGAGRPPRPEPSAVRPSDPVSGSATPRTTWREGPLRIPVPIRSALHRPVMRRCVDRRWTVGPTEARTTTRRFG